MPSGSFSTNTGVQLNLRIDWSYDINYSDRYADVTAILYIDSYSLRAQDLGDNYLSVAGNTKYFNGAIYTDGYNREMCRLTQRVWYNSAGDASAYIDGYWNFRGRYSGMYIDHLQANKTIYLENIGPDTPEIPDSPTWISCSGIYERNYPVTLTWSAMPRADKYYLEYRKYNHITDTWSAWTALTTTGNVTTYVDNNYVMETLIQYRVMAGNAGGWSYGYAYSDSMPHYGLHTGTGLNYWGKGKVYTGGTWHNARFAVYKDGVWHFTV